MARTPKIDPDPVVDEDAPPVGAVGEPHLVRLNKYLADSGVASRRKCDELIAAGKVTVDGETVTELGVRVDPAQNSVEIDGFVLKPTALKRRYYLLNKPPGVVCTNEAREMRPRAIDLITDPRKGRIYTIGRLDEESKGLILLTNDGDFAHRVMHPRHGIEKTYVGKVQGKIEDEALNKIRDGVHLSEGRTGGARILVERRKSDASVLSITIREGMNREIRRVFARFGYKVVELKRVRIGGLTERGIKVGRWRELTPSEVRGVLEDCSDDAPRDEQRGRRGAGRGADKRRGGYGERSGRPRDDSRFAPPTRRRDDSDRGGRGGRGARFGDERGARGGATRRAFDERAPTRRDDRAPAFADDALVLRKGGARGDFDVTAARGGRGRSASDHRPPHARAGRGPERTDTRRKPVKSGRGTRGAARSASDVGRPDRRAPQGRGDRAGRPGRDGGPKAGGRRPPREPRGRSNRK